MTDSHLYVHVHVYVEWLKTCLTSANGETLSMHRTCTPCTERAHHALNVHTMHRTSTPCTERPHHAQNVHTMHRTCTPCTEPAHHAQNLHTMHRTCTPCTEPARHAQTWDRQYVATQYALIQPDHNNNIMTDSHHYVDVHA